jgi:hypothetical protein
VCLAKTPSVPDLHGMSPVWFMRSGQIGRFHSLEHFFVLFCRSPLALVWIDFSRRTGAQNDFASCFRIDLEYLSFPEQGTIREFYAT